MQIMTDAELLAEIKAFISRHKMAPTRFGRETMRDGCLITQLEEGRSLSLKHANRVIAWMREADAAADRPRAA